MEMNRKLFSLILVAFSFVMLQTAAMAQSDLHVRANVPFGFVLENRNFAAGTYDITQLEPSVLQIRNADDKTSAFIKISERRSEVATSAAPSLVFHRYGAKYFLAQISQAHSAQAMAVPAGNAEQELARAKAPRDLIAVGPSVSPAGSK
jgi:hypothetical protein